ncbi:MAG: hydroxyacylglutathione hydrolase [Mariprofundaceae bacterium]|nr:hydroxyacylglutathione hydrolase [Mariprofundaceae bacterium]
MTHHSYQHQGFEVLQLPVLRDNYTYVVLPNDSDRAWVIDPADASAVITCCTAHERSVSHVWNTHHHWDHTDGNEGLIRHYHCAVLAAASEQARIDGISHGLRDHEVVALDGLSVQVLAVPGHTDGHLAFVMDDAIFCGDVLFSAGCGRVFEGTMEQMWQSLQRLAALPVGHRVYCAHEYTLMNLDFACTVADTLPDEDYRQRCHQRRDMVHQWRQEGRPSVPSTVADERAVNPFLQPLWREFVVAYAIRWGCNPFAMDVFTHLRAWRNRFVADQ